MTFLDSAPRPRRPLAQPRGGFWLTRDVYRSSKSVATQPANARNAVASGEKLPSILPDEAGLRDVDLPATFTLIIAAVMRNGRSWCSIASSMGYGFTASMIIESARVVAAVLSPHATDSPDAQRFDTCGESDTSLSLRTRGCFSEKHVRRAWRCSRLYPRIAAPSCCLSPADTSPFPARHSASMLLTRVVRAPRPSFCRLRVSTSRVRSD